jgi:hypothetical protein
MVVDENISKGVLRPFERFIVKKQDKKFGAFYEQEEHFEKDGGVGFRLYAHRCGNGLQLRSHR